MFFLGYLPLLGTGGELLALDSWTEGDLLTECAYN